MVEIIEVADYSTVISTILIVTAVLTVGTYIYAYKNLRSEVGIPIILGVFAIGVLSAMGAGFYHVYQVDKDNEVIASEFYGHYDNIDVIRNEDGESLDSKDLGKMLYGDSDWSSVEFTTTDGEYYDRARIVYENADGDNFDRGGVKRHAWIEVHEEQPDEWVEFEEMVANEE